MPELQQQVQALQECKDTSDKKVNNMKEEHEKHLDSMKERIYENINRLDISYTTQWGHKITSTFESDKITEGLLWGDSLSKSQIEEIMPQLQPETRNLIGAYKVIQKRYESEMSNTLNKAHTELIDCKYDALHK